MERENSEGDRLIHGCNVTKIGQGIYDLMPEAGKVVVAFGMLPKEFMDSAEDNVRRRLGEVSAEKLGFRTDQGPEFEDAIYPHVIREVLKGISSAIYGAASAAGRMVV